LLFLPLLLLGLFFLGLTVRVLDGSAATYTWQAVPCRIIASEVRESDDRYNPWFAHLSYAWSNGKSERESRRFSSYTEALRHVRRWPAASTTTCYVDAGDPAGALLERKGKSLALVLFLSIPLLFVFLGAGGLYGVVFRKAHPRPPRANAFAGRRTGAVLLLLIGAIFSVLFFGGPVRRAWVARSWRAEQCMIVRSAVLAHAGDEGGDTYSPAILYSYIVGDREHRSDAYSFLTFSGGRASAERTAGRYTPGATVTSPPTPTMRCCAAAHRPCGCSECCRWRRSPAGSRCGVDRDQQTQKPPGTTHAAASPTASSAYDHREPSAA
jgi:hypothetical protein